ncbi:MAG: class I adenylate-forming enzyme family protein [Pseudonocardiaceae bacterium]
MREQSSVGSGRVSTGPSSSDDPLAALDTGGPRVDDLLRRAARRIPDRVALRTPEGAVTYARLDDQVSRCAVAIRGALGETAAVVGLAAVLDTAFAVAYYGIARSGNIIAIVNPLLREDGLVHVLGISRARAVVVPPEVYRRLSTLRDRLPDLELVVLTHRDAEGTPRDAPTLAELVAATSGQPLPGMDRDPEAVICIQFTSGTTGVSRAVQLTHRNLVVNAAQTARAHHLDSSSVILNCLPNFHPIFLNIAATVTATQVLSAAEDVVETITIANQCQATHYYSLPVQMARLAADPRLAGLRLHSVRVFLSGGSALAPATATTLSEHFGIPVLQGYGLAETSASTHIDRFDRSKIGSVGPPVVGTECRIVDVDTREPLLIEARGEVQIRGPQLMVGYLDSGDNAIDAEGWLSTGDVGYLDDEGYLFVVDRLKDVFKCDNELVAPAEIERVLHRHPAVADCAVVDYPDEFSGAVAYALIVSRDGAADLAEIAEFVNGQVPYYQRLRHVELREYIPRSPNGKILHRELREQVRARRMPSQETPPHSGCSR